jgi:hypothetical protein
MCAVLPVDYRETSFKKRETLIRKREEKIKVYIATEAYSTK